MGRVSPPGRRASVRFRLRYERLESRQLYSLAADYSTVGNVDVPTTGTSDSTFLDSVVISSSGNDQTPSIVDAPNLISNQGGTLTVVATSPSGGVPLTQSPSTLIVTFDRPIDPFSVGFDDIHLVRIADDGTETPVFDDFNLPPETLDPTQTQLVITPNQALDPGHYRILLNGNSGLMGQDGSMLAVSGNDVPLADFSVAQPGVRLTDAIDLGTPGSIPSSIAGSLDFTTNPFEVKLYKFSLPAGQFSLLGAEVTAQRDGSPLDAALALFDNQGHVIATDETGRADAYLDPYLFAGLGGGTYYVGVSGRWNLPDAPGGYDPVSGSPGSIGQTQVGGPFHLHLVADPVEAPTKLIYFATDRSDPLDPTPTGFTVQFSGALRVGDLTGGAADYLASGVQVVDQNGHSWPVTASDYNESLASVSYLFPSRLPPGQYTVRLAPQGGLVDLSGRPPIGPGLSPDVLGTFAVAPVKGPTDPSDLGVFRYDDQQSGLTGQTTLDPRQSAAFSFVIEWPGFYTLEEKHGWGQATITRAGSDGTLSFGPGGPGVSNTYFMNLSPGVYHLNFSLSGGRPTWINFSLNSISVLRESLIDNGVLQGPALSLRLISPEPLTDNSAPPRASEDTPQPASSSHSETSPGIPGSLPFQSGGLIVHVDGAPLGRSQSGDDYIAPVGPAVQAYTVAIAYNGTSLPQDIGYGTILPNGSYLPGSGQQGETPVSVATRGESDAILSGTAAKDAERERDREALSQIAWLDRVAVLFSGRATADQIDIIDLDGAGGDPGLILAERSHRPVASRPVEAATLGLPPEVEAAVAFAIVYRCYCKFARLNHRRRKQTAHPGDTSHRKTHKPTGKAGRFHFDVKSFTKGCFKQQH